MSGRAASLPDPVAEGLAAGWSATNASKLAGDLRLDADVAIVGTGAGGGTAAEILTKAGLRVVMLEEGPLMSSSAFHMRESEAYPDLYQESAARKTKDKGIAILQGRCVGGSTTVNWTASFRTPPATLSYWQRVFGLKELTVDELAPWFAVMERRLSIEPWPLPPNENNDVLRRGAAKLGIPTAAIRRNVKGCWNLGYCGEGCPTNAKQSMLVTTIPAALSRGAVLVSRASAQRLVIAKDRVTEVQCVALDASGVRPGAYRVSVKARHFVLAAGAIGTPALLLRSGAPDPHQRLGRRTFLHPTCVSAAIMPGRVDGYAGAPQSVYCDHFLETQPIDGAIGYKLEVPPLHPLLMATTLQGYGRTHAQLMGHLPDTQAIIALQRDGFNPHSQGGRVLLKSDGSPLLDYPISDFVWDGLRRAYLSMAEIQFAAGAKSVLPIHEDAMPYSSLQAAREAIKRLPMQVIRARVLSAHAMGGCSMGSDARNAVVGSDGRHHQLDNVSVFDGSVFPTSVGANPQLSIYGLAARQTSRLAQWLTGRPAPAIA
ncbi:MAG TPA: GMC family oxidoreductase [Burkholderiales bacterium]|nr:GMC family oxidoreductase [Burkholderiales bacterium]